MAEILFAFFGTLAIPVVFGVTMSVIGVIIERRHLASLDRQEAEIGPFPIFETQTPPPGWVPQAGDLVTGQVVIGTGYLKQLLATLRTLVGGEVRSYQRVLDRGRREAQIRMINEARQRGASAIINARFETSDVGRRSPVSEIFCYGTAIR